MNKTSTRYFSDRHEKSICKALNAQQIVNSGGTKFDKGDVIKRPAYLLIEAKCSTKEKSSVSIKKEWIEKNRKDAFDSRMQHTAVCFNFEPEGENFYIIDEKTMKFLVTKLEELYL